MPEIRELEDVLALHKLADGSRRFTKYSEDSHTLILRCVFCEKELVYTRPTPLDLEISLAIHYDDCTRSGVRR